MPVTPFYQFKNPGTGRLDHLLKETQTIKGGAESLTQPVLFNQQDVNSEETTLPKESELEQVNGNEESSQEAITHAQDAGPHF